MIQNSALPRGIRNKNPGNIRRNDIEWKGMQSVQNDTDFVQFIAPVYGFRSMTRILRSYQRRGLTTIRQIISTYAPKNENDTQAYIQFVARQLKIDPDQTLDLEDSLLPLIKAIVHFENGQLAAIFYRDEAIEAGIALA